MKKFITCITALALVLALSVGISADAVPVPNDFSSQGTIEGIESIPHTLAHMSVELDRVTSEQSASAGEKDPGNEIAQDTISEDEATSPLTVTKSDGILTRIKNLIPEVKNNIMEKKCSFIGLATLLGLILLGAVLLLAGKRFYLEDEADDHDFDFDDDSCWYGPDDDD